MTKTVALPVSGDTVCSHFGHCEAFAFYEIDAAGSFRALGAEAPPEHAPGVFPSWLREKGVNVILAGGMGPRAQTLFADLGIDVVVGIPAGPADDVVKAYAAGTLETGGNVCSH